MLSGDPALWWALAAAAASFAVLLASARAAPVRGPVPVAWRGLTLGRHRRALETAERVHEVCEVLAAELGAGRPAGQALELAAGHWPGLLPVVQAHRVGLGVPEALRSAARAPGAGDLRLVAAAWQVSERSGHGLADAVRRVGLTLGARRHSRRVVDGELASARATGRLVAALPVVAIAMGAGTGADPVGFLLGSPVGYLTLVVGLGLLAAGLTWIEALARGASG